MKNLLVVLVLLVITSIAQACPIILLEDTGEVILSPPPAYYYKLFAPERQPEFIINGMIDIGLKSYSVFEDYTITERRRIWQECQKDLIYNDQDTLLYMYQYVVKPDPFPYIEFPLAQPGVHLIPAPGAAWLIIIGLVTLAFRRRV